MHEKIAYIEALQNADEHVLIVPGPRTEVRRKERSRIYSISSPLVSRTSRYRALLNLRGVEEALEREKPDIIESADPYQVGWKVLQGARTLGVPAVGFYHSHFAEAYFSKVINLAKKYVPYLYNQFAATLVPSQGLASVLENWGVRNVRTVSLGVNTGIFSPAPADSEATRAGLHIPADQTLLLYVGRLATEKNTKTLFRAFELLSSRLPGKFHLLVIGDGPERSDLMRLNTGTGNVTWLNYCADPGALARYYRAADLFVHPGIQETFGLVALESQACDTPVVGIRGSYMDEVIFHDQVSWARKNSPESLAGAVERCGELKGSIVRNELALRVGHSHSWPQVFDRLFCIYRDLCANYPNSRK